MATWSSSGLNTSICSVFCYCEESFHWKQPIDNVGRLFSGVVCVPYFYVCVTPGDRTRVSRVEVQHLYHQTKGTSLWTEGDTGLLRPSGWGYSASSFTLLHSPPFWPPPTGKPDPGHGTIVTPGNRTRVSRVEVQHLYHQTKGTSLWTEGDTGLLRPSGWGYPASSFTLLHIHYYATMLLAHCKINTV